MRPTGEALNLVPPAKLRVLIADDHNLVCLGLQMLLEGDGMEVLGPVSNGQDAVHVAQETIPDLVLLDLKMPGMDGFGALSIIHATVPHAKIIVTTAFGETEHVSHALAMGASGYITKDASSASIIGAVRAVAAGAAVVSSRKPLARALKDFTHDSSLDVIDEGAARDLTNQELNVLRLIGQGLDNKAISRELQVSVNTVRSHVSSILAKLEVENRTRAAIWAYQHGLVD